MANIEVLLREHVSPLGKCGDVVRVKPGYARNYLFPNKLATEVTEENKRLLARKRSRLDVEDKKRDEEIDKRVQALMGTVVTCTMKADDNGHLFGSVSTATVVELLAAQGFACTEKDVRLDTPIKTVGAHALKVHVHSDKHADITVNVNKEA